MIDTELRENLINAEKYIVELEKELAELIEYKCATRKAHTRTKNAFKNKIKRLEKELVKNKSKDFSN